MMNSLLQGSFIYSTSRNLDPDGNEFITEIRFRKIMKSKTDVSDNDVDEMLEEYRVMADDAQSEESEPVIFYKGIFSINYIILRFILQILLPCFKYR